MTDVQPTDGREQGPKWAVWNYETKEWDPTPEGYDPTARVVGTYGSSEEMLVGMVEERGWFRRRRTVIVIAASAVSLAAAAAGVGGVAWWRGR